MALMLVSAYLVGGDPLRAQSGDDVTVLPAFYADDVRLGGYITDALGRNPAIREAAARYRAALQRVPQVRSLPDPMVTFTQALRSVETRVGPQHQTVMLSQAFPWFGTLALREQVRHCGRQEKPGQKEDDDVLSERGEELRRVDLLACASVMDGHTHEHEKARELVGESANPSEQHDLETDHHEGGGEQRQRRGGPEASGEDEDAGRARGKLGNHGMDQPVRGNGCDARDADRRAATGDGAHGVDLQGDPDSAPLMF